MSPVSGQTSIDGAAPDPRRERIASVIMFVAALGAIIAFAGATIDLSDAGSTTVVVEAWRALGFLLFAGIFLLLALRPHLYPGIWELAFLHKAGMAIIGASLAGGDAVDAGAVAIADGILALMIATAYILVRGYANWRRVWTSGVGDAEPVT